MTDDQDLATSNLILVEGESPSNYSTWSPDLPGCVGVGTTVDECIADMRAAITFHLGGMASDGEPLPTPTGPGVYVEVSPRAAA